jgi:hypothetical protein
MLVAFLVRRHGLPTSGLWLDDAVVGAGLNASPTQLLIVGSNNPGFIAALMGWSQFSGQSDAGLAYPALIAGTLGPALLYLALRRFGYERSVSALLGAALVAAETDIVYSGRVKTYTIDVLIVLGLAMIVPRLARTRWRWQTGVAWIVAGLAVASFSPFALIGVAVGGVIIVLHPASDLRARIVAVGAQEAACLALFVAEQRTSTRLPVETPWRETWDAFLTFHPNPLRFGGDVLLHLRRLAETFPGGPGWFATLCILVALTGLVATAWRGRGAILARYLLLVLGVAFVGGVLGKFPFGPRVGTAISDGHRVSLWLIPVVAVGLAAALQRLRRVLAGRRALRVGFDSAAYLATAAILVSTLGDKTLPYPWPGAKPATDFVTSKLGRHDALLIPWPGHFSYAWESGSSDGVEAQPSYPDGFWPTFGDSRIHLTGSLATADQVVPAVEGADRVFVYIPNPFDSVEVRGLPSLGFKSQQAVSFGAVRVQVWRRSRSEVWRAANRINVKLGDLPAGWGRTPSPANPSAIRTFNCLQVPKATASSFVTSAGPRANSQLFAVSDVAVWPSRAAAQSAYAAFRGPRAPRCIQSATQSGLRSLGSVASVNANKVPPPDAGGNPAIAYRETVRTSSGTSRFAPGPVVFFTRGKVGVLISGLGVGGRPFPSKLLSNLVTAVAHRVNAATQQSR